MLQWNTIYTSPWYMRIFVEWNWEVRPLVFTNCSPNDYIYVQEEKHTVLYKGKTKIFLLLNKK